MRNWIWLGLAVSAAGLVWAWSLATASTEVSSIDGPQGKMTPHFWQEWKWSFPDDQWNPEDADAAEREARLHAQSQASRVEGTWTQHGPLNLSGRLNAIYEDTNPLSPRMFAGSAGGGLWRSTTGGAIWEPVTDEFEHMAVGCMAFHPETPEVMYVGTGDPQISGHPRIGGGAYKSVDGGTTWTHIGLIPASSAELNWTCSTPTCCLRPRWETLACPVQTEVCTQPRRRRNVGTGVVCRRFCRHQRRPFQRDGGDFGQFMASHPDVDHERPCQS